jgi:hypothetical protein
MDNAGHLMVSTSRMVASPMRQPGRPRRRRGRPRRCHIDLLVHVVELKLAGARLTDICDQLNTDGVPTPGGGPRWWPSYVTRLLRTYDAQQLREGHEVDGRRISRQYAPAEDHRYHRVEPCPPRVGEPA